MIALLPQSTYGSKFLPYILFVSALFLSFHSSSQNQVFANQVTLESNVVNASNATSNDSSFATLNSFGGLLLGSGGFSGELELQFPQTVPANTTTYIKIDFDQDVLNSLLGGDLGNLLADAVGNVVLGDHYFNVEARLDNTTVLSGSSINNPTSDTYRLVTDGLSNYYIAIKPALDYNRVYIEDVTDALLLGVEHSMNVYHAFHFTPSGISTIPLFTDFTGSNITVDALSLSETGVNNIHRAIDSNTTNFSEINLGLAAVGGSIQQNVYFSSRNAANTSLAITLRTQPSLVSAGIDNNIFIKAFDGNTEVFSIALSSLLNVDLLGLLANGNITTINFAPNMPFDRIAVGLNSSVNVSLPQTLEFYGIAPANNANPNLYPNQVFANQVTSESNVLNASNAASNDNNFAKLNSYGGLLLGGGSYTGELELEFPGIVPANTTTYIKIDFDQDILNSLLGGSLGGLLADAVGNVVLGDHYFNVEARLNSTTVLSASSVNTPSNTSYRLVTDFEGNFYIAIKPQSDYNRVYIQDVTDTLLLGTENCMSVFHAFYFSANDCATNPLFTDFDGAGITLDVLQLGNTGVQNPEFAIDQNDTNFSQISLGLVGLGASIQQNVYFNSPYTPPTIVNIRLKTDPTLVQAGILSNIFISASNGPDEVFSESLSTLLDVELLGLITNGQIITVPIELGVTFDRVSVGIEALVDVNLNQTLDFYGVAIPPVGVPNVELNQQFCLVDSPTVADLDTNGLTIIWYDAPIGGTPYSLDTPLVDNTIYYASQVIDGCESTVRAEVSVTVINTPPPTTTLPNQEFCSQDNPTIADLQTNETDVTWFDMPTGGTAFAATDALVDGQIYYGSLTQNGCESSSRLAVTATILNTPPPTTNDTAQEFCSQDNPTIADLQTNETDVTWFDMPTGGTAFAATDALVDGQIYYGSLTQNGCESSSRLAVTATIFNTPPPTTNDTAQEFCSQDNPTIADLQTNETDVTWFDMPTGGTAFAATDALVDGQTYYGSLTQNGCESSSRLAVSVTIFNTPPPTTNDTAQEFCSQDNPTIADLQTNETDVTWFDMPTGGTAFAATDALVDGQIYYGSLTQNGCESTSRLAVTATILNTPPPTTNDSSQEFCSQDNPTIADLQTNETDVTWFDMPTGGTAFAATDALVDGQIYYGSLTQNGCESTSRLAVTATIFNTPPPTTNDSAQEFCSQDNPTIADLQTNETDVTWFDMPTGGTAFAATDALVDGQIYYGSLTQNGCESSSRLAVTATILNTPPPTTNDTAQEFCSQDNPTIADLQTNETDVTWFDMPTGGTAFAATDALVDGQIYYGSLTQNGCESSSRLAVTATIFNTPPPTTNDSSQEFCSQDNPTIADLQVNEPDVTWFDMPTGGTAFASTDALVDGQTYYGSLTQNGCESSSRLAVAVSVLQTSQPTITADVTGQVCLNTSVTYTTEAGNTNYMWDFTGGTVTAGGGLDDNFITLLWNTTNNTTVSVSYDAGNSCSSGGPVTINETVSVCGDMTVTKTVNNAQPTIGENVVFTISVTNSGPNDFFDVTIAEDLPSGYRLVSFDTSVGVFTPNADEWFIETLLANTTAVLTLVAEVLPNGDYLNTASVTISTPIDSDPNNNEDSVSTDPLCIEVFNEFSPNGDGINEFFTVTCIERFANNEMQIYNRYGSLVYKKRGYRNDWDGKANVSGIAKKGEVLPTDTYYYVLTINDMERPLVGWVYLTK